MTVPPESPDLYDRKALVFPAGRVPSHCPDCGAEFAENYASVILADTAGNKCQWGG